MKTIKIIPLGFIVLFVSLAISSCVQDKEYNNAISTADEYFKQQKFEDAKTSYLKALEFKQDEQYPTQKIIEIDEILDSLYQEEIIKADNLFATQQYEEAKIAYSDAGQIKPGESYPGEKISEIDMVLSKKRDREKMENLPYHIIVGSYSVEANARKHQEELKTNGVPSVLITSDMGNNLVSIKALPDIHTAWNNLQKAQEQFGEYTWIYRK